MRNQLAVLLASMSLSFCASAQNDTWTQLDNVNGAPKSSCVGFVINNEGYIGLGLDENFERRQLYSYSVGANDWDNQEGIGNNL